MNSPEKKTLNTFGIICINYARQYSDTFQLHIAILL
jgi:hypothetical protein